jgi:signal transduction histidine kinase
MTIRLTARSRLAILYTALVFAAGVVLIALTYILVRRSLATQPRIGITIPWGTPSPVPVDRTALSGILDQLHAQTLTELLTQSAVALAIVTLLAAVLGWMVAGRILRPIRAVSATAQRLSAENLSERVPVSGPADELATLAQTINSMLDRIQSGIADRDRLLDSQRMFVANAAHELRTPLTTMRTAIDVTLDGQPSTEELLAMAVDVGTAIEHSQRTLDGLLILARSQTGPIKQRVVDLGQLAAGIIDTFRDRAATLDITLHTDLQPAPIIGEPVLLDRMVSNLVDNAMRYNLSGGHVTLTTGVAAAHATLHVSNTGQRIEPDEADRLFEPFVRGVANRARTDNGAGLGLSIVRAVALAHHGQLFSTARPTGGMDITVRFPTAPRGSSNHRIPETLAVMKPPAETHAGQPR